MIFVLVFVAILIIFAAYKESQRQKRAKEERERKEEEKRLQAYSFYQNRLPLVKQAVTEFDAYRQLSKGYFNYLQLSEWQKQYAYLSSNIEQLPYQSIGLEQQQEQLITSFKEQFSTGDALRQEFNERFINHELKQYSSFFNKIEGRSLDDQQRRAIITDEDNSLVIAGAGSGKTTTIVGKVNYLLDRYKVNPEDILLISFTRQSAQNLKDRINVPGIEAKTFHKFGMDVIAEVEEKKPSLFDEAQFNELLARFFKELISDQAYLAKVIGYFANFLKPEKAQADFKDQGAYFQYLKDQNFTTYRTKEIDYKNKKTIKREVVKSIEECKIANFLLFQGLDYEYESAYEHDTASKAYSQYRPDFTIIQGEKRVYIEHFAVGRNGTVPGFFAKEGETIEDAKTRYLEKMDWARSLHQQYGTTLIETYSYEMAEETLFHNLKTKLHAAGVILKPKSPEEIWAIIQKVASDEIKQFLDLFATFITLWKSNSYTIESIYQKNSQLDHSQRKRNEKFLEIIHPLFKKYEAFLHSKREIDFSDLINKAAQYITAKRYDKLFKYIIIDEFQDISIGRYRLVKALKDANPKCKLFCVGDDWQSIYRFTGSDIALFKEFETYFGFTVKSKIETTYRFYSPLIELSSDFILKNPNQAKKVLRSANASKATSYKIVYSYSENQDDTMALRSVLDELILENEDIEKKEILILGRYSFDINRIKNESGVFKIDKASGTLSYHTLGQDGERKTVSAKFLTVHKAKGVEADVVLVLNCNSGKHGFPSGIADDPVLNVLLSEADQFENGEERRLFYVAMTRAKENLILITDAAFKSKFITELEINNDAHAIKKCPHCRTADLVRRSGVSNGKAWAFDGCSNFMYGCEYKKWVDLNTTSL